MIKHLSRTEEFGIGLILITDNTSVPKYSKGHPKIK